MRRCSPATPPRRVPLPRRAWPPRGTRATGTPSPGCCSCWPGRPATPGRSSRRKNSAPRRWACSVFLLAWATSNAGALEQAEELGTEALGLFRALGDTGEQADALFLLGTVAVYSGGYERAAGFFAGSLARLRDQGDEKGTARALGGLGGALLNLGDRAGARDVLEESL